MKTTKSLTLHNIDRDLYTLLLAEANTRETSLNKVAQSILRKGVGLTPKKKKRDLSKFIGMWTKEEADKFDKIIEEEFEKIDEEDWK